MQQMAQASFSEILRIVNSILTGRRPLSILFLTWIGLFLIGSDASANSREASGISVDRIEVGFDGYYKVGKWTPLTAQVTVDRTMTVRPVVRTVDPDGSLISMPGETVTFDRAGVHQVRVCFKSGRIGGDVRFQLVDPENADQTLASARLRSEAAGVPVQPALRQSARIWGVLGHAAGFQAAADAAGDGDEIYVAALDDPKELPTDSKAYDGLDALVLAGAAELDAERSRALDAWVRSGGRLLLAVGSRVDGYRSSPLADWVPVEVTGTMRPRDLSALESFAGRSERLPFANPVATRFDVDEGEILAKSLDGPLLATVPHGFGRVTFVGLDLDRPPLSNWNALGDLCGRLLADGAASAGGSQPTRRARLSHTGISELATQLHAIQQHFPEIHRYSTWSVMGMMLVYLIVIGPVDYLLVHRVLRRPQLTWITFPVMVIAAGALAIWGGQQTNGQQLRLNQFDVIDVDQKSGTVRTRSYYTIYSPESRRYHAVVTPRNEHWNPIPAESGGTPPLPPDVEPSVTWSGIPENVFGGMYRSGGIELGRPEYRLAPKAAAVENLPVAIWSTKSLHAEWDFTDRGLVESDLKSTGSGQLSGWVKHSLPGAIDDWIVAYANRVFRPLETGPRARMSAILPNQMWDPNGPRVYQRELRGFLTRTTAKRVAAGLGQGEDILVEQAPYDPLSLEPVDLMRMITFHQAAGGTAYTGLENHSLQQLDLSPLLWLDRAVLFGRIELPASELALDGKDIPPTRHFAFVRLVLPVERTGSIRTPLPVLDPPPIN